jgi:hypothetical protein
LLAGLLGEAALSGDLAAVLTGVLAAVLAVLDLAAGIHIPQGHKQMGTGAP